MDNGLEDESIILDETDTDDGDDDSTLDADVRVVTDNSSYAPMLLSDMINKGLLITDPDYQRDFIYNQEKQSRVIESILMDVPIPTVYLAQVDKNKFEVIDGQQRIMSIVNFYNNKYSLKGLKFLKNLNKMYYRELPEEYSNLFYGFQLKAIYLKKCSEKYKYDIFARLNQGAMALNPQEIRNCIYRGPFNNMLRELAKDKTVREMFIFDNKRMKYEELILRFFALGKNSQYSSSIDKALNDFMAGNRDLDASKIAKLKNSFTTTLKNVKTVLGIEAFYGYNRNNGAIIEKFSPTVYDSIMLAFASFKPGLIIKHADDIRKEIYDIKKNDEHYKMACYAATGSKKNVFGRVKTIENIIAKNLAGDDLGDRLFDPKLKDYLFYDGYVCSYCGNVILSKDDAEIDHVVPYSMGGKTIPENAQLLHSFCNHSKNNRT